MLFFHRNRFCGYQFSFPTQISTLSYRLVYISAVVRKLWSADLIMADRSKGIKTTNLHKIFLIIYEDFSKHISGLWWGLEF
jgi:hypothetical protein